MSRTQTLKIPTDAAGTDLRAVLTLMPVPATSEFGGLEATDDDGGGSAGTVVKAFGGALLAGHLAMAAMALRDAMAFDDLVWDTAGVPKLATMAKIALVPGLGAAQFRSTVKPKLDHAQAAVHLIGG